MILYNGEHMSFSINGRDGKNVFMVRTQLDVSVRRTPTLIVHITRDLIDFPLVLFRFLMR